MVGIIDFYVAFKKCVKANGLCEYFYQWYILKIFDKIFILATDAKYYIFYLSENKVTNLILCEY